ncbi:hypothetical protein Mapa_016353 [Marchantia paleacea]|nr:hypothetical protein Mapa_016353 [Marchantia paleacea]
MAIWSTCLPRTARHSFSFKLLDINENVFITIAGNQILRSKEILSIKVIILNGTQQKSLKYTLNKLTAVRAGSKGHIPDSELTHLIGNTR